MIYLICLICPMRETFQFHGMKRRFPKGGGQVRRSRAENNCVRRDVRTGTAGVQRGCLKNTQHNFLPAEI